MKRCRILKLLPLFLIIVFNVVFAATFKGDWNGSDRWQEGWSKWSTTPSGNTGEVSMAVYLKPNWGGEKNETSDPRGNITIPSDTNCTNASYTGTCTVQRVNRSQNECDGWVQETVSASCGNVTDGWSREKNGECSCSYPGRFTGHYTNGTWWCKDSPCTGYNRPRKMGCTIKCYFYKCPTTGLESSSETVCKGWTNHWYFNRTSSFASASKANWNKTLSEAGGFARKIYIYSYPQRVYIVYNGNGANGTCSNPDTHGIEGDPTVCSAYGTGVMSSGTNVFINYSVSEDSSNPGHRNLLRNEYYKVGYDFLGWSLNKNDTSARFGNEQRVTAQDLNANAGDTKTLYAIWGKHTYSIRYEKWCGDDSALAHSYLYESTPTLQALNVNACKAQDKSGDDYSNANTSFISWYEDPYYNKKITTIPRDYHRDLKLYAKLVQTRYYDYPSYRWTWGK